MARKKVSVNEIKALLAAAGLADTGRRKAELAALLQANPHTSIKEVAEKMNISRKNVSSLLTYLRDDGWGIPPARGGEILLIHTPPDKEGNVELFVDITKK